MRADIQDRHIKRIAITRREQTVSNDLIGHQSLVVAQPECPPTTEVRPVTNKLRSTAMPHPRRLVRMRLPAVTPCAALIVGLASAGAGAAVASSPYTLESGQPVFNASTALDTVGSTEQPTNVGTLRVGSALFWEGPLVAESFLPTPEDCGAPTGTCFDYRINVSDPGARLRVAIDRPSLSDVFDIRLFDPSGADVTDTTHRKRSAGGAFPTLTIYSHETFASPAVVGVWTVRVAALNVSRSAFRMRAQLEKPPADSGPRRALLPNLQEIPPHELTFDPTAKQDGHESCLASEKTYIDQHYPNLPRCLRFSTGPQNVGQGRWEIVFAAAEGITDEGTAYQRVYYSDGTHEDVEAGTFRYHNAHGHYHHTGIGGFELLRVTDPITGAMDPVSKGPKIGMCTGDALIAEWRSARSDLPLGLEDGSSACTGSPTGTSLGLSKGWGEIYPWLVEGNFVPFPGGTDGDGLYVVRATADTRAEGTATFSETEETDNWSYAYIRVKGDIIDVLERGHGLSPWDPAKAIVVDTRRDHPDCPALTTQNFC